MKLEKARKELKQIQQSIASGEIKPQSLSDDDVKTLNETLSDIVILLGEVYSVRRTFNPSYAPNINRSGSGWIARSNINDIKALDFGPDGVLPHKYNKSGPISWNEMRRTVQMLKGIQESTSLDLKKIINWLDEYLLEDISCLWIFPAYNLEEIQSKYKGKKINFEKLEDHVAYFPYIDKNSQPYQIDLNYGILSFFLLWNNTCERDDAGEPPFAAYRDIVKIRVSRDGTILSIMLFECYEVIEFIYPEDENKDFDEYFDDAPIDIGEVRPIPMNKEHCQRLDALLSKILKPEATDEIIWKYSEIKDLPKNIVVRPRKESDNDTYCIRMHDFDFICENVPNCCGECSMLRWVYEELLPKVLEKESLSRLRKTVEDAGLFSRVDKNDLHICYEGCNKKDCRHDVRIAVNEIYRHYFEVAAVIKAQENKF